MSTRRHMAGFTLLELLVAVTIAVLLIGVMVMVASGTLNVWRRSQDDFTAGAQAKLVLDYLEQDLQSAVFRADGNPWLAVEVFNNAGSLTTHGWLTTAVMKPATESQLYLPAAQNNVAATIAEARFGLSGAWLRFVGTHVDSNGSLPVAIAYQIARRPVSGSISSTTTADVRYGLFRSAVSTAATFANGYNVTASSYGSSSVNPVSSRDDSTLTNPYATDLIATNVVDFGVWLYSRDSSGALTRLFPTANTGSATHRANSANSFPVVVDVMVRILTEEGAKRIDAIESSGGAITRPARYASDGEWWWGVVEANSQVFTRRVEIRGTAP